MCNTLPAASITHAVIPLGLEKSMETEIVTVSVYSESINERDRLRSQIISCGLKAICFERENTCIDNIKSIQPELVIVQTESISSCWRFLWSMHLNGLRSPMLIISQHLKPELFMGSGYGFNVHILKGPFNGDALVSKIEQLKRIQYPDKKLRPNHLIGQSEQIKRIKAMLPNIAQSLDSVLIVGERGVGKELLSRQIAEASIANNAIVKIDCKAIEPKFLVNGAIKEVSEQISQSGMITIILDGIHRASLEIQADLLLLVEETRKHRVGSDAVKNSGARFIATSEYGIEDMVGNGAFRKNLFYRLNVIPVKMPSLRERIEDIPLLMDYFIIEACTKNNKCIAIPSQKARELLRMHNWPANIDELKRYMYRVSADGHEGCLFDNNRFNGMPRSSGETLFKAASLCDLPKSYEIKDFIPTAKSLSLKSICDEFVSKTEKKLLKKALETTNWNRKNAASLLNISYKSMLNKMKVYDII